MGENDLQSGCFSFNRQQRRYAVGNKHLSKVLAGIGLAGLITGGLGGPAVAASG